MDEQQNITVKKSNIEGMGVFANRDFKKGEVVLSWKPKIINKDQAEILPESKKRYILKINDTYCLMQIPERYVNHSCNPNTFAKNNSDVAIRNIKKGEEITSNYSDMEHIDFECKCGNKNCVSKK